MAAIVHDVPNWTWASEAQFTDEECGLAKGGSVETLGVNPKFGTLLRYTPAGGNAIGTECRSGALVLLPSVDGWPAKGAVVKQMNEDAEELAAWVKTLTGR